MHWFLSFFDMGSQTVARFDNPAAERARVTDARNVLCLDVLPGVMNDDDNHEGNILLLVNYW